MFDELRILDSDIRRKQEELDYLKSMLTSISVPLGDKVQTSSNDRLGDLMCKIIIKETEIEEMIDTFSDEKANAKKLIFSVSEAYQDVLYAHYVEFKSFRDISISEKCTVNAVKQKNKKGLKCLKKVLTDTPFSC